ncbi:methylaspartate mutase subunit S [Halorussus aquaticus]|uniref:Methylaspartate mutase subunit S n=1 Tax=Halorussus aquaticus TaxID=2953748 RepID=A0ABD5Q386_9EURY|nr:methylaspartate mutase subunit S [Halorussus aquaticus]
MSATVILGVIGSDAHAVGITILEQALSAAGFEVVNLGVQSSQSEFVSAAEAHEGDAVLVSSLYGHAEQDCRGFHETIEAADLDPLTYIGGNLSVGQEEFDRTRDRFREMGFDRVFDSETKPAEAIAALKADMNIAESEAERARLTS